MGPFAQMDCDPFRPDLDDARCVDELPKQPGRARLGKAFHPFGQTAVQQVGQHRQRQVKVHVQTHVAAQAIEVEERDLCTEVILDVIPAGVGLDDFAGRLRLRVVIGQEEGRGFVPQPRHDQLPQGALIAVEPDLFLDIGDLTALPFGLRDLAPPPAIRLKT